MSIPTSAPLLVKLGELAHADVGVPGRRLVHHPMRGWVPEAERPWRIRWLPLWVTCLLPLGVLFGLLVPRHVGMGVIPPSGPASVPSDLVVVVPSVVVPPAALPPLPLPLPLPLPAPPVELAATGRPAPVAVPSRRPARAAASAPRRPASESVAPVVFNDPPTAEPKPRPRDVLVAIQDGQTIVAPDPRGLPVPFRVGELLPSGARLLRVDARSGEAQTDRGVIRLE
ncbi:hypothetical protein [Piscinibacter gummiphilus]|uniref:Uncharacterized protein n=1 Tax=Piscinibacter gummiphilus TaxID=946333 RepID=A0A1W6LB05_9BURK|nr:hypothetical protein [Piscinibacter gummiphilus]ARN21422.1 hypothetical protein A4W93_16790 [Piscinibacter gummiphilus]ATU66101.1 hypothetical protein CPZ87_16870 [Piscinibacter gummiphilus]GLS96228.1 hypothetical protein GCM10007918_35200 [Piscinibacter gummiphilus]